MQTLVFAHSFHWEYQKGYMGIFIPRDSPRPIASGGILNHPVLNIYYYICTDGILLYSPDQLQVITARTLGGHGGIQIRKEL